jgi:hypothetical protein
MRQEGPEQRHALAPGDGGEHEVVHLDPADRPLGPVEHQRPAVGAEHRRERGRGPVLAEAEMLEEALQPPVGRGEQRRPAALAGDVPEVHRAGTDHPDDQQAERLEPALAEGKTRP